MTEGFTFILRKTCLIVACILGGGTASAGDISWTLLDSTSGMTLASENANTVNNPGDFVKLMTLYTALKLTNYETDRFPLRVTVSQEAASVAGQQRIYLTPGQTTELGSLLRAIAVVGAEDACLAVADGLKKNRSEFVSSMNEAAATLKMKNSRFVSPVPNANNRSTSHDLAVLTQAIRQDYPEVFRWFADKTFTYQNNVQRSRNVLLWRNNEIDGVMSSSANTSFIASSSYKKNDSEIDRRLIAVYLNDKNATSSDAAVNAVLSLFVKGRTDFETIRLFSANTPIARLEVLGGNRDRIEVGTRQDIWVSLSKEKLIGRGTGGLSTTIEHLQPFWAPIKKDNQIAVLHVDFEEKRLASFPLYAMYDISEGSFFSRFIDSVRLKIGSESVKQ